MSGENVKALQEIKYFSIGTELTNSGITLQYRGMPQIHPATSSLSPLLLKRRGCHWFCISG